MILLSLLMAVAAAAHAADANNETYAAWTQENPVPTSCHDAFNAEGGVTDVLSRLHALEPQNAPALDGATTAADEQPLCYLKAVLDGADSHANVGDRYVATAGELDQLDTRDPHVGVGGYSMSFGNDVVYQNPQADVARTISKDRSPEIVKVAGVEFVVLARQDNTQPDPKYCHQKSMSATRDSLEEYMGAGNTVFQSRTDCQGSCAAMRPYITAQCLAACAQNVALTKPDPDDYKSPCDSN